jgi:hypothetical protein
MKLPEGVITIDDPAYPLLRSEISYWAYATANGSAAGTTIVDIQLTTQPSYIGHLVKVLEGNAAGQVRRIVGPTTGGTVVVDKPFSDSAGAVVQIVTGNRFVILSTFLSEALYYGTSTSDGAADGSTLIDSGLSGYTADDQLIGHTVLILTSPTATLIGQQREIYDYDATTRTLAFSPVFTSQVPSGTTYVILPDRPSIAGGAGPAPEPEVEEVIWRLADFENFDVADPTADTERWSSEYQVGAADGLADIHTTTPSALYLNITAAALAAAQYGVRRLWPCYVRKLAALTDLTLKNLVTNVNEVMAGLAISRGVAWDANNYIFIYKAKSNTTERIRVTYNLAGAGAVTIDVLNTTQNALAFKIERVNTLWRCYYSLTQRPRHHWILAAEIEDPTNSLTDTTSIYLTVYNPEDALGQRISCDFHRWEYYETLGNLGDIIPLVNIKGGALAYLGYCPPGMAASNNTIVCPNLAGFGNDLFNTGYQMVVLKNANALANPPEMEMRDITDYVSATGTFTTEAFSANVEANDIVIVLHNSVAKNISTFGIADAGSGVGNIRDAARTEADDWWNGQQVIMLSGLARGQVRPIYDFVAATDDIMVSPNFDAAVAAGDVYAILTQYSDIVPRAADDVANLLTSQVVGRKDDTAIYAKDNVSSILRYLKGLTDATITAWGVADAGSGAGQIRDAARTEADDWWNGQTVLVLSGAAAGQKRPITDFVAATDDILVGPNFDAAVAAGDIYVILAHYNMIVPRAADDIANQLTSEVVGRKDDTAVFVADNVSSIIRYLKGLVGITVVASGDADAGSDADTLVDAARVEANDYWNGLTLLMLSGNNIGLARPIVDFDAATDSIEIRPAYPNAIVAGDDYVILAQYHQVVPAADSVENYQPRDVIGNKTDTIPAMDLAPGNDSLIRHLKAILERVGQTPADPDDSLLTNIGQRDDAATADDLSDVATTSIEAKLRRLLLRMSSDAFTANIQGAARTELDLMLSALATYLRAGGAAFGPTIQGAAQGDVHLALAALAVYFAVGGAALNTQINPGAGARNNLEQMLSDLGDILTGAGITTFPAGAAAADGISIAEVIRYIQETLIGLEGATTLANKLTAARALLLDRLALLAAGGAGELTAGRVTNLDELGAANIPADTDPKVMGRTQIFEKSITSAANAGDVTVATITDQPCQIESVIIHADAAQTADMTSCGIFGGAGKVITFISAADAVQANLNAADKQVGWIGVVRLAATKTIVISLVGTGATAVDLTIVIKYRACASGGYLA